MVVAAIVAGSINMYQYISYYLPLTSILGDVLLPEDQYSSLDKFLPNLKEPGYFISFE